MRSKCSRLHAAGVVVVVFLAGLMGACTRSEWRELPVSDGGFSVLMRGDPHYLRQQVGTPVGKMFAHLYSSDRPASYFAVGYADYPLALVVGTPPERLFSAVRQTWIERIDGKLTASDGTIKLAGKYPGTEFQASGNINGIDAFMHARLYLVDQRLYQVISMGRKDEVSQGVVNRFLNSFRLIQQSDVGTITVAPSSK
jgi:hypothetical protein